MTFDKDEKLIAFRQAIGTAQLHYDEAESELRRTENELNDYLVSKSGFNVGDTVAIRDAQYIVDRIQCSLMKDSVWASLYGRRLKKDGTPSGRPTSYIGNSNYVTKVIAS